ncbi:MAG: threonylcarbamoyl-AMP synthase [Lachnospiraceae bacterium]|nr:threonylcarbamoyl-AMP synthase [Lachnospiraceae bacterium]
MNTKIITLNEKELKEEQFTEAAAILQAGGLVAFPTETVYGLGGDGLREDAARKIYAAKGRPSDNPLIIHIADTKRLAVLTKEVPEAAKKLAEAFWPGPLTMIFEKATVVPKGTTGGLDTVAIRMPEHAIARKLIQVSGVDIAAPSANASGRPSPTLAKHVIEDLDGKIDMIIDGGAVGIGLESTIVDMTGEIPTILRPGFITKEMLQAVVGEVKIDPAILEKPSADLKPKAPGMKYKHYAPKADLHIYEGDLQKVVSKIKELTKKNLEAGKRVGIIATEETRHLYLEGNIKVIGSRAAEETIAHSMFAVLREFDEEEMDIIYSESFTSDKLGAAIMNRMLKASGYQIENLGD